MSAEPASSDALGQRGVSEAPALLAEASRDFGGLTEHQPALVARVHDATDVQRALSFARSRGMRVVARGQGHSTRGQASAAGGVVIDMRAAKGVKVVDGVAIAQAGVRWDALLQQTLEQGLTPAVLTDYVGLSVGGTLSVGGVGGQSFRHGLQVDQVEALKVVTGAGQLIECSSSAHADLFDACRGGLGQCAIVVEARLRLVQAPRAVRVFRLVYTAVERWLEDQRLIASDGRFDYILGSVVVKSGGGLSYCLEVASYQYGEHAPAGDRFDGMGYDALNSDLSGTLSSYQAYATRLHALEAEMKADGSWYARHPWIDLFVPWHAAAEVITSSLSDVEERWLASSHTLTYPVARPASATPFAGLAASEPHLLFGIGPSFAPSDTEGLTAFEASSLRLFEHAQRLGARCYPIGFPVGTEHMNWPRHFGGFWARFQDAKRRYDPGGLLSALDIF